MEDFPDKFGIPICHTTRKPRPGDQRQYRFMAVDKMYRAAAAGKFIETSGFCSNMYGTSKDAVDAVIRQGKICLLDVDVQGAKQIKHTDLNPFYVFVKPPSLEVLKDRLAKTESESSIARKLQVARGELETGKTVVTNLTQ